MENLDTYFAQIGETEPLEPAVEADLIRQAYNGRLLEEMQNTNGTAGGTDSETAEMVIQRGHEAQTRLVTANLKFVPYWLKKHEFSGRKDFADLIQWGNVGLVIAARRIEPRGVRFITYADHCIRSQVINNGITNNGISVPVDLQAEIARQRRERDNGETAHPPTRRASSTRLLLGKQALRPAISLSSRPPSKYYWHKVLARGAITDEENPADPYPSLDEVLPALAATDNAPGDSMMATELTSTLMELIGDRLNPTEQLVIGMRFGLHELGGDSTAADTDTHLRHDAGATLGEVAGVIGGSIDQAREIQNRALSKLRHPRTSKILREYV